MSQCSFIVSLMPAEVMDKVKVGEGAEIVYEEFYTIGNGKYYGTLIFDKYYMRAKTVLL